MQTFSLLTSKFTKAFITDKSIYKGHLLYIRAFTKDVYRNEMQCKVRMQVRM